MYLIAPLPLAEPAVTIASSINSGYARTVAPSDSWWVHALGWSLSAAIVLDLIIVALGYQSISMGAWIETNLHPTLIAAGILGSCFLAVKVRKNWKLLYFWGIMTGHLFVHQ